MTVRSPTYLKSRFENGDTPSATDFEDVFDSYFSLATSASQTIEGRVTFQNQIIASEVISPLVSATTLTASFVSAQTGNFANISSTTVSAVNVSAGAIYGGTANIATVSAGSFTGNTATIQTVSANSINVSADVIFGCFDISAVATTQAGAITINGTNNFIIFADGNNLAVKLPTSVRGKEQRIINASSTVLKVFPAVSGRFLVTAVNASLNLPADRTALIIHKGDDRYGFMVG